jgi:putative FmdB family regulatory protein
MPMPFYEYHCESCDYEFDELLNMVDRKKPESSPCPKCQKQTIKLKIATTHFTIGDTVRLGIRKPDREFRDVLKNIKKNHPHHGENINRYT